ncbi:MAG: trehalose-6-phosphate synthase, partial [Alphaproteobacteria bacterium]|nr:trehalose-6-phosphate synthase [Alphaproteobacteria bacterium]
ELRGKVVLVQIAPPSREDVPEYVEMRHQLEAAAGEINGRHAEFDYVPIRYLNKGVPRPVLAGFLRAADIGLITPMRDGMNLVAKEFVAAQDPTDPGVLVLSRFAGAAQEMDGAILVNPYDEEGMSRALMRALEMGREERIFRWHSMFQLLVENQVTDWFQSFIDALDKAGQPNPKVLEDFE